MSNNTVEQVKTEVHTTTPKMYKVVFHNDDKTTFEFVIYALYEIFGHDFNSALLITQDVHEKGAGVVGVYDMETAEMKTEETIALARHEGYPLVVTYEPE